MNSKNALSTLLSFLLVIASAFEASAQTSTDLEISKQNELIRFEEKETAKQKTLSQALYSVIPDVVADAATIDLPLSVAMYTIISASAAVGLGSAIPFTGTAFVTYNTLAALAAYTGRKTCNEYLNPGENNTACGLVFGPLRYLISGVPTAFADFSNVAWSAFFMRLAVGAYNNGVYEYNGPLIGKAFAVTVDEKTGELLDVKVDFPILLNNAVAIEGVEGLFTMALGGSVSSEDHLQNVLAGILVAGTGKIFYENYGLSIRASVAKFQDKTYCLIYAENKHGHSEL